MSQPVILTMCDYYLPGYIAGGTPRTVANMVDYLGDRLSFRVVTRDRDLGQTTPYPDCPTGTWLPVGKAQVLYLPPRQLNFRVLRRIINATEHDALYLSSFFHPRFTIIPLVLRRLGLIGAHPTILAPHGEFSPAALRLKQTKKLTYIGTAKALGLYRGLIWHASSEFEEQDIRRWFGGRIRVCVARDLPSPMHREPAPQQAPRTKAPGTLSMAFLSRVNRKKNLDGALRMLAGLPGEVEFHIYGPYEDPGYWSECRRLIEQLPANVRVAAHGPVAAEDVLPILRQHHLFFFPTLGENFGHVILESLLAGCPVLVSDRTFWRGLAEKGAGWDVPLERPEEFRSLLQRCVAMDDEEFQQMSARARQYGDSVANDQQAIDQNCAVFQLATGSRRLAA